MMMGPPDGMMPPGGPPPGMEPPGAPPPSPQMGMPEQGGLPVITPPEPEPDWSRLEDQALVRDINLSEKEELRIKDILHTEIARATRSLKTRNEELTKWRKQYKEVRETKTYPFKNCSNVCVPLTPSDADQITARTVRVLSCTEPQYVVEPALDQEIPIEELHSVQQYMKGKLSDPRMGFDRAKEEFVHSMVVTGLGQVKWDTKTRNVSRYEIIPDAEMTGNALKGTPKIISKDEVVYEGNVFEVVRPEDFFYPPECHQDPDLVFNAYWVGHRFLERLGEMQKKAKAGVYREDAVKRIADADERDYSQNELSAMVDRDTLVAEGLDDAPVDKNANQLTNFEIYIRVALEDSKKGKQPERDCVFVYNYETKEILSAKYLFFFHGRRPFVRAPFKENGEFFGIGVPQQLQHLQRAANDLVNQGIDAGTYANLPVIAKRKDSVLGRGKQDDIYPGKIIEMDDVSQLQKIDLGDTSASVFQFLPMIREFAQKRTGVTDFLSGMEGERGNRESAAGAGQRTGNSSPLFDVVLGCVRRALEDAADLMFWNCWQFKPDGDEYQEQNPKGDFVKKLFTMPPQAGGRYRFRIMASSVAANPEVRKQTIQHLSGILDPLDQQLIQTAGQIGSPDTPPLIRELLVSAMGRKTRLMRQTAEAFDLPGAGRLVPDWDEM